MNVKFILFCIASLGCLMMMYLWFSMHKAVINSQLNEEQYLYRISSLKSEIDCKFNFDLIAFMCIIIQSKKD